MSLFLFICAVTDGFHNMFLCDAVVRTMRCSVVKISSVPLGTDGSSSRGNDRRKMLLMKILIKKMKVLNPLKTPTNPAETHSILRARLLVILRRCVRMDCRCNNDLSRRSYPTPRWGKYCGTSISGCNFLSLSPLLPAPNVV